MILDNPYLHALILGVPLLGVALTVAGFGVWYERRFAAWIQLRYGPIWVGPQGLFQIVADALKMMQKEDFVPASADRALFKMASWFPMFLAIALLLVVPLGAEEAADGSWKATWAIANLDMGVLWPLAMGGLLVFPLWAAGWSSNNKYSLLAGMRMVAQGISYEIPMVLTALVPVILAGSLSMDDIVTYQMNHGWFALWPPGPGLFAFIIFFLTSLAEADRVPFDIPEAESEIIGGITIEYSGIRMGLFVLTEYLHTFVAAMLAATLFLGGPHMPFSVGPAWLGVVWLLAKTLGLFFVIYWIRWTWLRYRADQLMNLAWHWLVPVSLGLVMLSAVWVQLMEGK